MCNFSYYICVVLFLLLPQIVFGRCYLDPSKFLNESACPNAISTLQYKYSDAAEVLKEFIALPQKNSQCACEMYQQAALQNPIFGEYLAFVSAKNSYLDFSVRTFDQNKLQKYITSWVKEFVPKLSYLSKKENAKLNDRIHLASYHFAQSLTNLSRSDEEFREKIKNYYTDENIFRGYGLNYEVDLSPQNLLKFFELPHKIGAGQGVDESNKHHIRYQLALFNQKLVNDYKEFGLRIKDHVNSYKGRPGFYEKSGFASFSLKKNVAELFSTNPMLPANERQKLKTQIIITAKNRKVASINNNYTTAGNLAGYVYAKSPIDQAEVLLAGATDPESISLVEINIIESINVRGAQDYDIKYKKKIRLYRTAFNKIVYTIEDLNTRKTSQREYTINPTLQPKDTLSIFEHLKQIKDESTRSYLQSFLVLFDYLDGAGLKSAIERSPHDPWATFEPLHFESYKAAMLKYYQKAQKGKLGIASNNQTLGAGNKKAWIASQMTFLENLQREVANPNLNVDLGIRSEGILAGGPLENNTRFYASPYTLAVMSNNPYLTLDVKNDPDGVGYLVRYYYPDIFHYEKIKPIIQRIDPTFFAVLESTMADKTQRDNLYKKDHQRRNQLNKTLIKVLLEDLFDRYFGKTINFRVGDSISFLQELISIHPFSDLNGRTIRLYYNLSHIDAGLPPSSQVISDLDLFFDTAKFRDLTVASSDAIDHARFKLLEIAKNASASAQMPIYFVNDIWENLFISLSPLQYDHTVLHSFWKKQAVRDLISRRAFGILLKDTLSPNWHEKIPLSDEEIKSLLSGASNSNQNKFQSYLLNLWQEHLQ